MNDRDTKKEPTPATASLPEPVASDADPVDSTEKANATPETPTEDGGPKGPEPTRFGDWERKGRCIDF
ncbi:MAG: DUF1674 domain-containing protein [Rhodospirillales bacterium]|nr:DUF1674 domain-containing protein [Rhodospirillales bacterium]